MISWRTIKRSTIRILGILLTLCLLVPLTVGLPTASAQTGPSPILELAISGTARVVDYDNGTYVVGTTTGELYVLNDAGEYTTTQLGAGYIYDVRIEFPFVAVAAGSTVIELSLAGLQPQELWRVTRPRPVFSADLSEDGDYVAYLSYFDSVGVITDGSIIDSYPIYGAYAAHWLDATGDMEFIAITAEPAPYAGTKTGVELYAFNGTSISRQWGKVLVYDYETTEVRISEAKDYIAVATSSGTIMNLLDLPTGDVLWQYDAVTQEQFACDGDDNLNYVIGATQAWAPPYRWFVFENLETSYDLLAGGNMTGPINDLDATPDGSYFAFASDAGEVVLLQRTDDTVEEVFTLSGLPLIDAIEIGSSTLLVGGNGFINLYPFQATGMLLIQSEEDTTLTAHILALNVNTPIDERKGDKEGSEYFDRRIADIVGQGGLAFVAHPDAPRVFGPSSHRIAENENITGIEVYNAGCMETGVTTDTYEGVWNDVLNQRAEANQKLVWGIATDDAHSEDQIGKTWVMVRAPELKEDAVLQALEDGSFYAVRGPSSIAQVIEDIRVSADGKTISVAMNDSIPCSYTATFWRGIESKLPFLDTVYSGNPYKLETYTYEVHEHDKWVRIEISFATGGKAWTQPFMCKDGKVVAEKNPYQTTGSWYKAQLHCHTTRSDGHLTPKELVDRYSELEYDTVAITDHNRITEVSTGDPKMDISLSWGTQIAGVMVVEVEVRGHDQQIDPSYPENYYVKGVLVQGYWKDLGSEEVALTGYDLVPPVPRRFPEIVLGIGDGLAHFYRVVSPVRWRTQTYTFVVTKISKPGWTWDGDSVEITTTVPGWKPW